MATLKLLLIPVRILAWIALTGLFWFVVKDATTHPVVTDIAAVVLFFAAYLVMPRINFMEKLP